MINKNEAMCRPSWNSLVDVVFITCFIGVVAEGTCGAHRITDKLFSNTRYFVIKSNNYDNVDIAKTRVSMVTCV